LDEIMLVGHVHYNKSIRDRSVIRMITSWNIRFCIWWILLGQLFHGELNIEMGQCPVKLYNEQLLHLIECGRMITIPRKNISIHWGLLRYRRIEMSEDFDIKQRTENIYEKWRSENIKKLSDKHSRKMERRLRYSIIE